jgi:UDP-3-O-[3-hydroxymyristoyl] N-acetylglucosamine deacetylase
MLPPQNVSPNHLAHFRPERFVCRRGAKRWNRTDALHRSVSAYVLAYSMSLSACQSSTDVQNTHGTMMGNFQTLRRTAQLSGIGLHSGETVTARLLPRHETGIVFVRRDLPSAPSVVVAPGNVTQTTHATVIGQNGAAVSTTEHLLATLWAMGITNCRIELDGPEVPILDGSALPWCRLLQETGLSQVEPEDGQVANLEQNTSVMGNTAPAQRSVYTLREPVWVSDGSGSILGLPHHQLRLTVAVEYERDYLQPQTFDAVVTADLFADEMAPARTFTLEEWIEPLRAQGLIRGGSTENAVVLGREAPSSSWRFENELARHKALDVLGDIALLFGENGGMLHAHLIAIRGGHGLHRRWMEECLRHSALVAMPV